MDNIKYNCVKINFSDYSEEIGILRRKAWEVVNGFENSAFPQQVWLDDLDKDAIHWAVFEDEEIIASARLGIYSSYEETPYMEMMLQYKHLLKLPIASLNRLVVSTKNRKQHVSKLLDAARIEEAKKIGAKTVVGQAVHSRIKALECFEMKYIADIGCIKELPNIELSLMMLEL